MAKQLSSFQPNGVRATQLADTSLFSDGSLVSYWKLDESSGDASDSKGSNTLINNNTVTFAQGKFGNCADTGSGNTNKWMNVASNLGLTTDGTGNITVSGWINMASFIGGDYDMQFALARLNQRQFWFGTRNSGSELSVFVLGSSLVHYNSSYTFATSTWYHVAFTMAGTALTLYVNGVNIGSHTIGALGTRTGFDSFSLFRESGDSKYASGKIDDVAVFSRALSPAEIQTLYYAGSTKLYMPLNGNSVDISGSNNHGMDTAITYVQGKFGQGARFNGSSSQILFTNVPQTGVGAFTASLWIKGSTLTTNMEILAWGTASTHAGFDIYMNSSNVMTANFYGGGGIANATTKLTTQNWQYVTVTYDGTNTRMYINGVLEGISSSYTSASVGTTNKFIGKDLGGGNWWNGLADEIILENRAWTAQEISLYYRKSMLNYRTKSLFNLIKDFIMTGDTAVFTITGYDASLTLIQRLVAETANFIITGYDALTKLAGAWRNPDNKSSTTYTNPDNKSSTTWTNKNKNS